MIEKRFTSERTDDYNFSDILDNGEWIGICHIDSADDFVRKFNELSEENKQLKDVVYKYSLQIIELEKENKRLIKMLDNVANYMQREHKEIPVNQFVDWWNNIATMGIKE